MKADRLFTSTGSSDQKEVSNCHHAGTSTTGKPLRFDLTTDRYFLIVMAYDLHEPLTRGKTRHAVWILHVNIRFSSDNSESALSRMSQASADYFGRNTDEVKTIVPRIREGKS